MDLATFRAEYPEFATASDTLVEAKLARAEVQVDAAMYGDRYEQAHGLLTAHLICIAPGGQFARLVADNLKTTYGADFDDLRDAATTAVRVF